MEEEKVILNPIQKAELERAKILDFFFPSNLALSSDLQQLILDFVFVRKILEKKYNGDKCWARLGLTIIDDKFCYEIKVYHRVFSYTFSTCSLTKPNLALQNFALVDGHTNDFISMHTHCWSVDYEGYNFIIKEAFCPKDEQTYKIEARTNNETEFHVRIIQIPKEESKNSYYEEESLNMHHLQTYARFGDKELAELEELIRTHGSDWTKYPQKIGSSDLPKLAYIWPVEPEI